MFFGGIPIQVEDVLLFEERKVQRVPRRATRRMYSDKAAPRKKCVLWWNSDDFLILCREGQDEINTFCKELIMFYSRRYFIILGGFDFLSTWKGQVRQSALWNCLIVWILYGENKLFLKLSFSARFSVPLFPLAQLFSIVIPTNLQLFSISFHFFYFYASLTI